MIQAEKSGVTVSKCLKKCDIGRIFGQKKGQVLNRLAAFFCTELDVLILLPEYSCKPVLPSKPDRVWE